MIVSTQMIGINTGRVGQDNHAADHEILKITGRLSETNRPVDNALPGPGYDAPPTDDSKKRVSKRYACHVGRDFRGSAAGIEGASRARA